jgi:hypothetical protein
VVGELAVEGPFAHGEAASDLRLARRTVGERVGDRSADVVDDRALRLAGREVVEPRQQIGAKPVVGEHQGVIEVLVLEVDAVAVRIEPYGTAEEVGVVLHIAWRRVLELDASRSK